MATLSREEHLALLTAYGLKDAMIQNRALPPLLASAKKWGNMRAYKHDCKLQPVLRDMTALGIPQSLAKADQLKKAAEARSSHLLARLREVTGIEKLNPRASKQVASWLYETKHDGVFLDPALGPDGEPWEEGDGYSVGRPALLALEDRGVPENVAKFINLQIQFASLRSLMSGPLQRVYDSPPHPSDPENLTWLRPSFRKETSTGRLISNPNVQNYTKRGFINVRTLFKAPPGHVFVVTDSGQLELRLYAAESGDEYYCKAFREGLDAHSLNVVSLMSSGEEIMAAYEKFMHELEDASDPVLQKVRKSVRTLYKTVVFGMLYGAGYPKVFDIMSKDVNKSTGERAHPNLKLEVIQSDIQKVQGSPPFGPMARVNRSFRGGQWVH